MSGSRPSSLAGGPEEIGTGPGDPPALAGRRGAGRDVPGGREAAEVVEADQVHVGQQGAQAVDPPAVSRPAEGLPVVERVAPELALGLK